MTHSRMRDGAPFTSLANRIRPGIYLGALLIAGLSSLATFATLLGFKREWPDARIERVEIRTAQHDTAIAQLRTQQEIELRAFRSALTARVDTGVALLHLLVSQQCAKERSAVARAALGCQ